jgi:hypothetical protein
MWTGLADVLPYTTGLVLTPFALIAMLFISKGLRGVL